MEQKPDANGDSPTDSPGEALIAQKGWWRELWGVNADRRVELVLAFAITFFAAAQWITSCVNNSSTSKQVDHMITAANRMDDAADRFSTSSGEISKGVRDAVDKLNLQASSLSDSAIQANRLADDTEKANQNVIEADRPWMGGYITVTDFTLGKKPNVTVAFINSGKRPARLDLTVTKEETREVFPKIQMLTTFLIHLPAEVSLCLDRPRWQAKLSLK